MDAAILNKTLDKLMNEVRQVIYEMIDDGRIDIFAIPARLDAKRKKAGTFPDFVKERLPIHKHGQSPLRQKAYDRFFNFLDEYGKFRQFSDVNEHTILELDRYLQKKKMMASSRWANYHRFLNTFIRDAQKENLMTYNPYDRIRIDKGDDSQSIERYLSAEELRTLRSATMPTERLDRVRDLFVFQCFTCMAYVDLAAFSAEKVKVVDGNEMIFGKRGKTGIEYQIPLLRPAKDILDKYNGQLPAALTAKKKGRKGVMTNQQYNKALKEVVEAAGLGIHVTTHWARHTGATMLLNAGVEMDVIAKVGGWSDTKVLRRIYAKLHPETVVKAVNEIEDKLM
jgi:site-specific recombinase XerD